VVGKSRDVAMIFYEDVLAARLGDGGALRPMQAGAGLMGDNKQKAFAPLPDSGGPTYPTSWLPTERVARAWRAMLTEQPIKP
jgi:hypothetical protein